MVILWGLQARDSVNFVKGRLGELNAHVKTHQEQGTLPKLQDGDICLGFGRTVLGTLQKHGHAKKNRTISSITENPINIYGAVLIVTHYPTIMSREYSLKDSIEWAIKMVRRLVDTGSLAATIGDYRYVKDYTDTIEAIRSKLGGLKKGIRMKISLDLETMGLVPYYTDKHIVSIAITHEPGQADVIRFVREGGSDPSYPKEVIKQVEKLTTHPKLVTVGANLKYDKRWIMEKWGFWITNDDFDTTLVGSLIQENRPNSLENHTKIYVQGMGGYDREMNTTYDKAHMENVPDGPLLTYAGGDTDACYQVATVLHKELRANKKLNNFYNKLVQPASKSFAKMEHRGVYVNKGRFLEVRGEVVEAMKHASASALKMIPRRIRLKYSDKLVLTRDVILREFLFSKRGLNLKPTVFTERTKMPSCAIDHLESFSEVPEAKEFVAMLKEYNTAAKTVSTFIDGFLDHLMPDGKFHTTFNLHNSGYSGSTTGRTSSKGPGMQIIPKNTKWAKKLRSVYEPPKGHVIVNMDFSQGELRVVACVAKEQNMLHAYRSGMDLHSATGAKLAGYSYEEFMALPKDIRTPFRSGAKASNFGLLYGMSWRGYQKYARSSYKVVLSDEEAQAHRRLFLFEAYPGLSSWHESTKKIMHRTEEVVSPLGRIRHLPLINIGERDMIAQSERQGINAGIQSTLSDLTQFAMVKIDKAYPDIHCFLMCHDSLSFYLKEDEFEDKIPKLAYIMENLPIKETFGWDHQLPFLVDAEVSALNFGAVEEYEFKRVG